MARGMKRDTKERSDDRNLNEKAFDVSKNDWIALYTDLYRQAFGEAADITDVYTDALKRLEILRVNGIV